MIILKLLFCKLIINIICLLYNRNIKQPFLELMRNPRILKIINIEPFKIETLWTNDDVRLIDFADKLASFSENERYKPLLDFEVFSKVEVGEGDTLCWQNIQYKTAKGKLSPLAFDPDVLFAESQ